MAIADLFDRADSALSLGHPSDGGVDWTVHGGVHGISGNRAYIVSASSGVPIDMGVVGGGSYYSVMRDCGSDEFIDITYHVSRNVGTGEFAGIWIAFDPATTSGYLLRYQGWENNAHIMRIDHGTPPASIFDTVDQSSVPFAPSPWPAPTTIRCRMERPGGAAGRPTFTVWQDGVEIGSWTESSALSLLPLGSWVGHGATSDVSNAADYWYDVATVDPDTKTKVLTCYTDAANALQLSLQEIDYSTGIATVLQSDTITPTDVRLPGGDPTLANVEAFVLRVSADTVLVGYGGSVVSGPLTWFGVIHVDEGAGTFSLGNFLQNYTWSGFQEIAWSDYNVHVLDASHVLYAGQVRDLTGGARTHRWHVIDVSGATPSIAWGYTDATLPLGVTFPQRSPVSSLTAIGYQNPGTYQQMLIDIDMGAHTVTYRDVIDPTLHTVEVPNPVGEFLYPYSEREQALLSTSKWTSIFDVSTVFDAPAYIYMFVVDQTTGDITSKVLLGNLPTGDANYEADAAELFTDSRGALWALVNLQTDGPLQTMTLAKVELDSDDIVGVNARILLDSDDAFDSFMASMFRDLYDLGNGVAAAWGKHDSVGNTQALYAGLIADNTSVFLTEIELLPPTVGGGLMRAQAIFVGTAQPLPVATTAVISAGSGSGDQLEVTTWSHSAGAGSPAVALLAPPADSLHEQHKAHYTKLAPTLIVAGRPVNEPLMAGVSHSSGTIGIPNVTEELAAAIAVDLGSTWRWLPGDDYHAGGSGFLWDPFVGSGRQWEFPAANAPYIDPAFSLPTSHGPKDKPALIFAGEMYGQIPVDPHAQFTVAIVTRLLHSPISGYYDIFSSPSAATDPVKGTDLTLRHRGARIRALVQGKRYIDTEPEQWVPVSSYTASLHRRATVLVWSMDQRHLRFGVMSGATRHITKLRLADVPGNFDLNFFLGRNGGAYSPNSTAHMQVFDLALWRDTALDRPGIRRVLHKLNGVYGVYRA